MNSTVIDPVSEKRIRRLNMLAWIFTIVIWLLVGAMRQYKFEVPVDLSFLAGLNALFNTGVSIALLVAYYFIKQNRIESHRKSIYAVSACDPCRLPCCFDLHRQRPL